VVAAGITWLGAPPIEWIGQVVVDTTQPSGKQPMTRTEKFMLAGLILSGLGLLFQLTRR
jgi:hypothetical protein